MTDQPKVLTRAELTAKQSKRSSVIEQTLDDGSILLVKRLPANTILKHQQALQRLEIETISDEQFLYKDVIAFTKVKRDLVSQAVLDGDRESLLYTGGVDDELLTGLDIADFNEQYEAVKLALGLSKPKEPAKN